jgi:hypothetical protein
MPLSSFVDTVFTFNEEKTSTVFNKFFDNMGISSLNILVNVGSMVMVLVLDIGITIVVISISMAKFKNKT